jgi:hypothetical protein
MRFTPQHKWAQGMQGVLLSRAMSFSLSIGRAVVCLSSIWIPSNRINFECQNKNVKIKTFWLASGEPVRCNHVASVVIVVRRRPLAGHVL